VPPRRHRTPSDRVVYLRDGHFRRSCRFGGEFNRYNLGILHYDHDYDLIADRPTSDSTASRIAKYL
jgi:hypothetical protein